jgi:ParB family chromosome partitioning protein
MNAVTNVETEALEAVIPAQSLLLVSLADLRPSKRNVRKTGGTSIAELAASIGRVGLLQNLTVIATEEPEQYEVVGGGRRLAALKLLAKKKRIAKDYQVPCLLVPDAAARTASLSENVQREAMHPADQFEAFAALIVEGRSIEDVAADFGVAPLTVQRRLKLANVSPRLMKDYRAGNVNLEQLMAVAITDDHAAQEAAFYDTPEWQRSPDALREHLTDQEIEASRSPLARFVGMQAYEAAGGEIRRDLFAEDDDGVFLTDAALLTKLANDKLSKLADEVRAEGWGWVEAAPNATHADLAAFQRAPTEKREPTAKEAKRIAKLEKEIARADEAVQAAIDAEDEDKADKLQDESYALSEELDALYATLVTYSETVRAAGGAVVTLDREGQPIVLRGLLREAEAKALRTLAQAKDGGVVSDAGGDQATEPKSGISEKLARRLSAHRTAALQVELARNPQVALAALAFNMVGKVLRDGYAAALPIGVSFKVQDRLEAHAPDLPQAPAATLMQELGRSWAARLPEGGDALFSALVAMPGNELVSLLALCVARTVDGVSEKDSDRCTARLAQSVGLDMGAWWTPTAEGYFTHVSKATILDGAQQFAPSEITRLGKLKKADLASEAERLAAGTAWLPPMLRAQDVAVAEEVAPSEIPADEPQAQALADTAEVEEVVTA